MENFATLDFIHDLLNKCDSQQPDENLISSLHSALAIDGFKLVKFGGNHLRGLAEEEPEKPGDPDFATNLILVMICVMCAGFASGLTQV